MVERRVQPLKQRAHLICDYTRVEDPTCEVADELEDDAVIEWMAKLVGIGIIVMTKSAIMAFSMSRHPDLVSRPFRVFPLIQGKHQSCER